MAVQATVRVGGESGWFASGRVHIDAQRLINGKVNELDGPWLGIVDQYKADNWSKLVWAEFEWPDEVEISGLTIHEDERHPDSWPYDCCLQIWRDGAWHDAAVSIMNPGPYHNLELKAPRKVKKVRYWVTGIVSNNVWTDEIRIIRSRAR